MALHIQVRHVYFRLTDEQVVAEEEDTSSWARDHAVDVCPD